jgi:hypothetical protein
MAKLDDSCALPGIKLKLVTQPAWETGFHQAQQHKALPESQQTAGYLGGNLIPAPEDDLHAQPSCIVKQY